MPLAGNLADVSLPDVIHLISSARRRGLLRVVVEGGATRVYWDQGRIVHAEGPTEEGEEAIWAVLEARTGYFEFDATAPVKPATIHTDLVTTVRALADERRYVAMGAPPRHPDRSPDPHPVGTLAERQRLMRLTLEQAETMLARLKEG